MMSDERIGRLRKKVYTYIVHIHVQVEQVEIMYHTGEVR